LEAKKRGATSVLNNNSKEKIVLICSDCKQERRINKNIILEMPDDFVDQLRCAACGGGMKIKCHVATIITK
jgi:hypothetical protein